MQGIVLPGQNKKFKPKCFQAAWRINLQSVHPTAQTLLLAIFSLSEKHFCWLTPSPPWPSAPSPPSVWPTSPCRWEELESNKAGSLSQMCGCVVCQVHSDSTHITLFDRTQITLRFLEPWPCTPFSKLRFALLNYWINYQIDLGTSFPRFFWPRWHQCTLQ